MTDAEAKLMLPAVEEFIIAVRDRDEAYLWACFHATDPRTLAIWCAELLRDARLRLAHAERVLHATRDIEPSGLSRARAWEIAEASAERRSA